MVAVNIESIAWAGVGALAAYYLIAHYRKTGAFI